MRVITWNVNGLRAREADVLALVQTHAPDVLCLQEIKAKPEQVPASLGGLTGMSDFHSCWHGTGGYSGVSLHLRKSRFEKVSFGHPSFDFEARVVEATSGDLSMVSMYLPNGGKDFDRKMDFMRELALWSRKLESRTVCLCGDMNVTRGDLDVHPDQRSERTIGQRPEERALFEQLFASGLVDVGRTLAPDDDALFTWWAYWNNARKRNVGWRLDYVIASPALAGRARASTVLREFGASDHAPVVVDFDV